MLEGRDPGPLRYVSVRLFAPYIAAKAFRGTAKSRCFGENRLVASSCLLAPYDLSTIRTMLRLSVDTNTFLFLSGE